MPSDGIAQLKADLAKSDARQAAEMVYRWFEADRSSVSRKELEWVATKLRKYLAQAEAAHA
jgi:hypothetical protein